VSKFMSKIPKKTEYAQKKAEISSIAAENVHECGQVEGLMRLH